MKHFSRDSCLASNVHLSTNTQLNLVRSKMTRTAVVLSNSDLIQLIFCKQISCFLSMHSDPLSRTFLICWKRKTHHRRRFQLYRAILRVGCFLFRWTTMTIILFPQHLQEFQQGQRTAHQYKHGNISIQRTFFQIGDTWTSGHSIVGAKRSCSLLTNTDHDHRQNQRGSKDERSGF